LERGTGGRAYFVNDQENLTFCEFVAMVASVKGLSVEKLRSMPYGIAFFVGRMMEAVWAMRGLSEDPPLSRSMVRMIGREFSTSDAAARRSSAMLEKNRLTRACGSTARPGFLQAPCWSLPSEPKGRVAARMDGVCNRPQSIPGCPTAPPRTLSPLYALPLCIVRACESHCFSVIAAPKSASLPSLQLAFPVFRMI
jgi:hypothetical protein